MKHYRQYRIYSQKFVCSHETSLGEWKKRQSIVLRQEDEQGRVSFGEVLPTIGFVNPDFDEMLSVVSAWSNGKDVKRNPLISSALSCLNSKIWDIPKNDFVSESVFSAELLNSNLNISNKAKVLKKKIGLKSAIIEISEVLEFIKSLPITSLIRLDANGSLSKTDLFAWNEALSGESRVQFLEQPFPKEKTDELLQIESKLDISLALDESLVWQNDLSFFKKAGWTGFYVIKPFLFPDWDQVLSFIKSEPQRSVVSTVFESPFGYEALIRCAAYSKMVAGIDRSLFQGDDREFPQHHRTPLYPGSVASSSLDELWDSLL